MAVPIGSYSAPNDGEPYYADMTSVNRRSGVVDVADRLLELVELRVAIGGDAFVHEYYEDVLQLLRWLEIDRFDRRAVNRRLAEHRVIQIASRA